MSHSVHTYEGEVGDGGGGEGGLVLSHQIMKVRE